MDSHIMAIKDRCEKYLSITSVNKNEIINLVIAETKPIIKVQN